MGSGATRVKLYKKCTVRSGTCQSKMLPASVAREYVRFGGSKQSFALYLASSRVKYCNSTIACEYKGGVASSQYVLSKVSSQQSVGQGRRLGKAVLTVGTPQAVRADDMNFVDLSWERRKQITDIS